MLLSMFLIAIYAVLVAFVALPAITDVVGNDVEDIARAYLEALGTFPQTHDIAWFLWWGLYILNAITFFTTFDLTHAVATLTAHSFITAHYVEHEDY